VLRPAEGIYAAWARWDGGIRPAAVHVGRRLTFEGASTVEAHLLDTDADLYGRRLTLAFVRRLRDDERFDGPQALAAQIGRDVAAVRERLGPVPPPDALRGAGACEARATPEGRL
jgi:riboflavin kinase / FMN adenylyltransferase